MFDPDFVRERAAWFNEGVVSMVVYSAIAITVVWGMLMIGIMFFDLSPSTAFGAQLAVSWIALAHVSMFLGFTARERARRGGVEVDRF